MIDILLPLAVTVVLVVVGLVFGRSRERAHIRHLDEREAASASIIVTDLKTPPPRVRSSRAGYVSGSAVIATDYFKTLAAQLRAIVGGEVKSLGTLIDRARREARLRMVEEAKAGGAVAVINVRIETSEIGGNTPMTEVFAYGTALYL
ncbi:MAG: heavy metal-binding domain-containing protein [Acidimicrobiia bacterium]|nr:YbjQ family protein [Acidimicrobiia bacterium]NNF63575.1 heavy metal-binding domain-containing protein [Acidimicrobiia bacterium]